LSSSCVSSRPSPTRRPWTVKPANATRTSLRASDLPDDLKGLRSRIEAGVPHGRTGDGGKNDRGAWRAAPARVAEAWADLAPRYERVVEKHPRIGRGPAIEQLGTLGTGNHFIEVCLDEEDRKSVV